MSLEESYSAGSIEVILQGKKLQGGYNLIKMKGGKMKGNWLLIKQEDEFADSRQDPVRSQPHSAVTGRSLNQISQDEEE